MLGETEVGLNASMVSKFSCLERFISPVGYVIGLRIQGYSTSPSICSVRDCRGFYLVLLGVAAYLLRGPLDIKVSRRAVLFSLGGPMLDLTSSTGCISS